MECTLPWATPGKSNPRSEHKAKVPSSLMTPRLRRTVLIKVVVLNIFIHKHTREVCSRAFGSTIEYTLGRR
jgi:hypothetical protein